MKLADQGKRLCSSQRVYTGGEDFVHLLDCWGWSGLWRRAESHGLAR